MAIYVHGFRKPTLEVSLAEGGSLAADTTYYLVGAMGMTPKTYVGLGGPLSDLHQITTTSTHKSITISHKTYRDIESFADNGDGRTLVASERHCLTDGDTINIDTGSYTGSWSVVWVDYHNYIIDTAYVDDVPVESYTDSNVYNVPTNSNSAARGMAYFLNTVNPFDADGYFTAIGTHRWSRNPWQTNNIENPTTITALSGNRFGAYSVTPGVSGINRGYYEILKDYGAICVDVDANHTLQQIYDEVYASGFKYNCEYSRSGYVATYHFALVGALRGFGASAAIYAQGVNMTVFGDLYHHTRSLISQFDFPMCALNFPMALFTANWGFKSDGGIIYCNSSSNTYEGWIEGDGTVIYAVPRVSSTVSCDEGYLSYTDEVTGLSFQTGIVRNKEFRATSSGALLQTGILKFENVKTIPFYLLMRNSADGTNPDIYLCENVEINGSTFDFRIYTYQIPPHHHLKFLNVDTNEPDNKKRVIHNNRINIIADFFRRINIRVKSGTDVVEGAEVEIDDGQGHIYTGFSDIDGYLYIDVLEQRTQFTDAKAISSVWQPAYDTYYPDMTIIVKKAGFQDGILYHKIVEGSNVSIVLPTLNLSYSRSKIVNS